MPVVKCVRVDTAATLVLPGQLGSLRVVGGVRVQGLEQVTSVSIRSYRPAHLKLLQDVCTQHGPSHLALKVGLGISSLADAVLVLQEAAAAVGASTNLASLDLDSSYAYGDEVHWCSEVAKLRRLRKLRITCDRLPAQQLLHLTACSSLTSLRLQCDGVDDFTAVGLLNKLPQLQELVMKCCDLRSMAVLGSVSSLTDLTVLQLCGWSQQVRMRDHHLHAFLPLQKLQELDLPLLTEHCSEAAVAALQVHLPRLQLSDV